MADFDDNGDNLESIKALIDSDPDLFISELSKLPALLEHCHPQHRQALRLYAIYYGFDKESQQQDREADAAEAIPIEVLEKRKVIAASDAFKNHLHKDHIQAHRAWLNTFDAQEG